MNITKTISEYYFKRNYTVDTLIDPYRIEQWTGSLGVQYYISIWQRLQMGFYLLLDGGFTYNYDKRKVERLFSRTKQPKGEGEDGN